ncbi:putative MFS-type transporter [Lasiodiplodia theobromae]|uniref:Putative MFS-type transporter n=1 Tax=Lasiodiplodia theobromae TaxID=45133 RepID=A0A5N5DIX1_9PEZI|nr:putative MFS-type transporter [Lasiodiplodia theobromae]
MSHSEKNIITWDGPDDPENPFNWPSSKKWRVTVLACSITFLSGISGTALAPTAPLLTSTFHLAPDATRTIPPTYYPIFAWTLSAGVIPLLLLPLMETYYGVRTPYLLCVLTLALSTIPQALAPGSGSGSGDGDGDGDGNGGAYPLLIAIRILTGGAAGVLQNVTGGIVGDVWAGPRARSKPVALYIWALVGGLMAGPVVGGGTVWGANVNIDDERASIGQGGLSWRYVCWEQLAIYAALVPLAYLLLPETRGSIILARRAAAVRKATGDPSVRAEGEEGDGGVSLAELLKDAVGRPLRMLTTEPLVACSTLWSAFCFGNALLFTQSIPRVYGELYGWESWRAGVVQAGLLVGVTLGLVVGAPVQDALYYTTSSLRKKNQQQHQSTDDDSENGNNEGGLEHKEEHFTPEARLYLAIPASFLCLSGGLFLYAWTSSPHIHWLAPTSGLVLVGAGIFTVVTAASNYVEDAYSRYAASALAGVAFGENMTGAFLPLAEQPLYTNLGSLRWASCLLAFVAVALSFAPVVMVWKGEAIRKRSPFIKEAMYESTQGAEFVGPEGRGGPQSV